MASTSAKATVVMDKFDVSYEGIGEVLKSSEVRDEMTGRGEKVLAQAKSTAPVDTGAYQAGLHLVQQTSDRAYCEVQGSTDHDWIVEANTGNLNRALDQAR